MGVEGRSVMSHVHQIPPVATVSFLEVLHGASLPEAHDNGFFFFKKPKEIPTTRPDYLRCGKIIDLVV